MKPLTLFTLLVMGFATFAQAQETPTPNPAGEIAETPMATPEVTADPTSEAAAIAATTPEVILPPSPAEVAPPNPPKSPRPFSFSSNGKGFSFEFDSNHKDLAPGRDPGDIAKAIVEGLASSAAKGEISDKEIENLIESNVRSKIRDDSGPDSPWEAWVAIIAITFTFGTPVLVVALVLAYRMRKRKMLHQIIQDLIAAGQPIPPELLTSSGAKAVPPPHADRRRGIILITVGLGIVAYQIAEHDSWGFGLIPLTIGVGYLLTAKFAPRHANGEKI